MLLRKEILKVCSPNDFAFDEEASLREHKGLLKKLRIPTGGIITKNQVEINPQNQEEINPQGSSNDFAFDEDVSLCE